MRNMLGVLLVYRFDLNWNETGYRQHQMFNAQTLWRFCDGTEECSNRLNIPFMNEVRLVSPRLKEYLCELFTPSVVGSTQKTSLSKYTLLILLAES